MIDRFDSERAGLVFKSDARSHVWLRDEPGGGALVIKRFEHHRLEQRLLWWIGMHPAQRERRAASRMAGAGLAVVPILEARLIHGRGHVVTPYVGQSLDRLLPGLVGKPREVMLDRVAAVAGDLLAAGWVFRDLKAGNIVLDAGDRPHLIDTGSAYRPLPGWTRRRGRVRTLEILDLTLGNAGATPKERAGVLNRL